MKYDVFISHSSEDRKASNSLCSALEKEGIKCWVAPRDIDPGQDWAEAITEAIENSLILVLIFSSYSNSSKDVIKELTLAANFKLIVIPFRIGSAEPTGAMKYYLSDLHWLDAFNPPSYIDINKLVERIKPLVGEAPNKEYSKPSYFIDRDSDRKFSEKTIDLETSYPLSYHKSETPKSTYTEIPKSFNYGVQPTQPGQRKGKNVFLIIFYASLFVFFYFYNHYIAFYEYGDYGSILKYPLLTADFDRWIPIISAALIVGIIGNIVLMSTSHSYTLQITHIVVKAFFLIAMLSLLSIFPFDFSVNPNTDLTSPFELILRIIIILIALGIGASIIVRLIRLIRDIVRKTA